MHCLYLTDYGALPTIAFSVAPGLLQEQADYDANGKTDESPV
jgi:hypothetical protein